MKTINISKSEERLLITALNYVGNSIIDQVRHLKTIDREMDTESIFKESNQYFDLLRKIESSSNAQIGKIDTELETRTEHYDWGNLLFVYPKDQSWKAVFHPENLEDLFDLKVGEEFRFTDEQGKNWNVRKIKRSTYELTGSKKGVFSTTKNG